MYIHQTVITLQWPSKRGDSEWWHITNILKFISFYLKYTIQNILSIDFFLKLDCFEANVFLDMVSTKQTLYIYCQLSIDKLNHRILINVWIENLSLTLHVVEERFQWWSRVPKFRPSKETFWEWRNLYCAKTLVYFQTATRETGNFSKSD